MGEILDELARTVAAGGSRRDVLKQLGGGLAAAVLLSLGLGPKVASANGACHPCGSSGAPCCGCCSGTTGASCQSGTSSSLCGIDGERCKVCPANTRCSGGQCTCCPSNQPGCGVRCATGQPCTPDGTCGSCTNPSGGIVCGAACKLPNGATCNAPAQCASGVCSTGQPRTCVGAPYGGNCACPEACGQGICIGSTCTCPPNYVLLSNGTCARPNDNVCSGCQPACHAPDIDGTHDYCSSCSVELLQHCTSDSDCPKGYFCQSTGNFCNLAC